MERIIEICCGSYEDALNAYYGRAKRIELNSALHLGGLTPSIASLKLTKKNTNLKIITMIRPRGAGFCYNDIEFEVMKEDARCMLENKADGIAFGCLNQDGSINEKQTKEMIDIIKEYQGEVVFHRAFDCVADPYASIELLIHLGVDRILTSGLKPKAMDGKELIKERHRHRYEFNNNYKDVLVENGLKVAGFNPERNLVEIVEIEDHPYYVGCQFHPEFTSRPNRAQPLFQGLISAAHDRKYKK